MAASRVLPILILISFDGFRYDYLNEKYVPNLFELSRHGTTGHMESMYITKTFPNHFSMVTGLYEENHEVINNVMFDPRLNKTFRPGDWSLEWWDPKRTTIPIWTANELYGAQNGQDKKYSGSMMYPGGLVPFQGSRITHYRDYDDKRNWTKNVDTVIEWLTDSEKPANFVAMYFDDPDSTAHWNGPWGDKTLTALRRVDDAAGYLIEKLKIKGLLDHTNLVFVSDHGMSELNLITYLSDFMDTSDFDLFGNSPDWSVFIKPEKLHLGKKIFSQLQNLSKEYHYKIYKRSEIPPEYHYSKTPRIGEFFILVDKGHDLFKDRSRQPKKIPDVWGNHGWLPTDIDMRPLFMTYGPSFKKNYHHSLKFPNIDIFPLMVSLLGLPHNLLPNNGSFDRISDIIRERDTLDLGLAISVFAMLGLALFIVTLALTIVDHYSSRNESNFDHLELPLDIYK